MFPTEVTKSVAVYHIPSSGTQEYPASANATISGALLPMDRRDHALEGGAYTDPFELYVDGTADVRIGDKLVIDSTTYYAKQVFTANFGGLAHKRISISSQV